MSEIKDPWYSRPIDVHRWSDHPEVKGLTEKVWREAGLDDTVSQDVLRKSEVSS